MQSSFAGIEIGKRSLITHTQGLNTIGHNMSNADVEGYSRQRIEMSAADPLYVPGLNREDTPGQIGQGVETTSIRRIKDMLLQGRIVAEKNGQGYWQQRDKYILMLEQVYNEPSDLSVRALMDKFWESWQELSLHPGEMAARKAVLQRGLTLVDAVHKRYSRFKGIRDEIEGDVQGTVSQVNSFIKNIASLNTQIVRVQAMGDNPNDLLDRRDLLVEKLSSLIDITVNNRDPDEFTINSGGMHIVQGKHYEALSTVPDPGNEGYSKVVWKDGGKKAYFSGGKLASLVELRDSDTKEEIQKLDLMAVNFMDLVNEIHKKGYGLNNETGNNFFVEYPFINNVSGNYDRNGDGQYDSSYIFRLTGGNTLKAKDQIGLKGILTLSGPNGNITVPYHPTDTVEDVIKRINLSGAEVSAHLDYSGRLSLKGVPSSSRANPDFVIRHVEDSGQFLAGYAGILSAPGKAGTYDWAKANAVLDLNNKADFAVAPLSHPSGWVTINPKIIKDPGSIVSSFGYNGKSEGTGDGSAALAIAGLRTKPVMIGLINNFDDYFSMVTAEIGLKGEQASYSLQTEKLVMKELTDQRESISGVNIDEEVSNMIKYQRGYEAAARFVTEMDKMLDVIINRMAV